MLPGPFHISLVINQFQGCLYDSTMIWKARATRGTSLAKFSSRKAQSIGKGVGILGGTRALLVARPRKRLWKGGRHVEVPQDVHERSRWSDGR